MGKHRRAGWQTPWPAETSACRPRPLTTPAQMLLMSQASPPANAPGQWITFSTSSPPAPESCQQRGSLGLQSASASWGLGFFFFNDGRTFPSKADAVGLHVVVSGPSLCSETPLWGGALPARRGISIKRGAPGGGGDAKRGTGTAGEGERRSRRLLASPEAEEEEKGRHGLQPRSRPPSSLQVAAASGSAARGGEEPPAPQPPLAERTAGRGTGQRFAKRGRQEAPGGRRAPRSPEGWLFGFN